LDQRGAWYGNKIKLNIYITFGKKRRLFILDGTSANDIVAAYFGLFRAVSFP